MSTGNTAVVAIVAILVLVLLVFFLFLGGFNIFQRDTTIDVDISPPAEPANGENRDNGEEAPQNYYYGPFMIEPQAAVQATIYPDISRSIVIGSQPDTV